MGLALERGDGVQNTRQLHAALHMIDVDVSTLCRY